MPSVAEFYGPGHRGTKYGVVDKLHPNGHSGADFNEWKAGTRIPSFVSGRVVLRGSTSNFGNWISVQFEKTRFAHFCHLENLSTAPALGTELPIGSDAGPIGNTGYSKGNHLHAMVSGSANPEAYSRVEDPMPYINAAISGGGGGGFTPDDPQEDDMKPRLLPIVEAVGNPPTPGTAIWFDGPSGIRHVEGLDDLTLLARYISTWNGVAQEFMYSSQVDRLGYYTNPLPANVVQGEAVPFSLSDIRAAVGDELADDIAVLREDINRPRIIS